MPQPKKELDYSALNALLQFKVTLEFCADYLGVSRDTIMRRLKEDHGMTFYDYHKLKMEGTATKLQQKVITEVLSNPTKSAALTIFALKNIAGWTDKQEISQDITGVKIVYEKLNENKAS